MEGDTDIRMSVTYIGKKYSTEFLTDSYLIYANTTNSGDNNSGSSWKYNSGSGIGRIFFFLIAFTASAT